MMFSPGPENTAYRCVDYFCSVEQDDHELKFLTSSLKPTQLLFPTRALSAPMSLNTVTHGSGSYLLFKMNRLHHQRPGTQPVNSTAQRPLDLRNGFTMNHIQQIHGGVLM